MNEDFDIKFKENAIKAAQGYEKRKRREKIILILKPVIAFVAAGIVTAYALNKIDKITESIESVEE